MIEVWRFLNLLAYSMKEVLTSPKFIMITIAILAIVVIPLTIIQSQTQQNTQQEASENETQWQTDQSASAACPTEGGGAEITVKFNNTEPNTNANSMDVIAKDNQSGKSVNMGTIRGGSSKTSEIDTERETLNAGTVTFSLKWTDGHSGVDSRTASYKAVGNCKPPTPTPTKEPSPTPLPSGVPSPTPTVCPTLGPVKNVTIECPNCP